MPFSDELLFENALIKLLTDSCGWEPEVIKYPTEKDLIRNWANILYENNRQRDRLNDFPLTDGEMQQIIEQIKELKTPLKLNGFINGRSVSIKRDNPDDKAHFGKEVSLKIYDRKEIAYGESRYQIARQPKFKTAPRLNDRRGDLMLLINGMPVIHIELKRSNIPVSNAYNQIEKYAHEGVFTGIFSLVQIFVAMEPEETVYFANPGPDGVFNKAFYFHWADFNNEPINAWDEVVKRLLNIPMAHMLIGFYTIPDDKDDTLKVMRSYQYYAATGIADKVTSKDWTDTNILGGHIWHTTGSGKTLTSFKSAQLIASSHDADKVIFLVDRKALGKQSFDDYNAFASIGEEVQDTADTEVLVSKLTSDNPSDVLIVTSIQKLSGVTRDAEGIKAVDLDKIVAKRIVIIIDEAHRSTFGEMLSNIKKTFTHCVMFGFTGTPIQEVNKKKDNTTASVFGDELHRYTLADGIRDKNVLGFDPYMVQTYRDKDLREQVALMKAKASKVEEVFGDPKKEKVFYKYMDPTQVKVVGEQHGKKYVSGIEDFVPKSQYEEEKHQKAVVSDILENWLVLSRGGLFHAIFATSSIPEAVQYYRLMKGCTDLKITAVFDPNIDNEGGGSLEKEDGIVEMLEDYEKNFGPSFTLPTYDQFREDVQLRLAHKKPYHRILKDKQINILIVVNQMLTGYDSKWINTLYLDKVMEYENLIQAFSRTNRLFGDEKTFGIIKYYRYPHTMERNIREAVKAYSGDIPTGLFVDKLPSNLNSMNYFFREISEVFQNAGVENFEKLPDEKSERAKFAKLFKHFNLKMEAASVQGFSWDKTVYPIIQPDGTENYITLEIDEPTYLTLVQRYKELSSGGGGGGFVELPFEIDTHIVEINTDAIDAAYMNSRFEKFLKLIQQGESDKDSIDNTLRDLHKSFAMLSQEEQKYANVFIRDVRSGNIVIDPDKTFREYISSYMKKAEDGRIARIVRRLGCDEDKLRDLLCRKVTEDNYQEFGKFKELTDSVDQGKAEKFFQAVEQANYKKFKLKMYVHNYLKGFVLSGGIDPFTVTPNEEHPVTKQPSNDNRECSTIIVEEEPLSDEYCARTTINSKQLSGWHSSSKAFACMMETGCFAYVENKVCLDDPKYIERQEETGHIRLTAYAKEHEEECCLQFKADEKGNLHYVKLPISVADKEFRYSDYIDEDILNKYGLVNEIAHEMLLAINNMEFGSALKELMSTRICNYSVGLLRSTTGLDNRTIANMWDSKNLTIVNVVSACLGIHLPYPVSSSMLELANISIRMDKPPQTNMTYVQLLTLRWASDYGDIYDSLKEEGMADLIKQPPI